MMYTCLYVYFKFTFQIRAHTHCGSWLSNEIIFECTSDYRVPAIVHEPPMQSFETMSKFPVVVFSHGLSAMRSVYSMIHCDLASQGYIVAAVEHK